jgi:hypothetical protein
MYFLQSLQSLFRRVFMSLLQSIENELEQLKAEYAKFENGNKSAGTRARKHLQSIKKAAQDLRNLIQDSKKEECTQPETEKGKAL